MGVVCVGWPDITYLVKLGAVVVLEVAVLGSLALAGVLTLQGQPLPPYILALAGGGIAQSLTILSVHIANGRKNGNGNGNGYASSAPSQTGPTGK